jgi:hypothetical protein
MLHECTVVEERVTLFSSYVVVSLPGYKILALRMHTIDMEQPFDNKQPLSAMLCYWRVLMYDLPWWCPISHILNQIWEHV